MHGGEPVLLVGLALLSALTFTSPLHRKFLDILARLDLACTRYRKASLSDCVSVENFQPSWARSRIVNSEISLRRAENKFYNGLTGRRDLGKKAQPFQEGWLASICIPRNSLDTVSLLLEITTFSNNLLLMISTWWPEYN